MISEEVDQKGQDRKRKRKKIAVKQQSLPYVDTNILSIIIVIFHAQFFSLIVWLQIGMKLSLSWLRSDSNKFLQNLC